MIRPVEDTDILWTALLIGLWIPNFFYWGLNQYIVQRTLGSKSLAERQKGIVFAAFLKPIIPFVVVIPGIMAFNLFSGDMLRPGGSYDYDSAFPVLARNLVSRIRWSRGSCWQRWRELSSAHWHRCSTRPRRS